MSYAISSNYEMLKDWKALHEESNKCKTLDIYSSFDLSLCKRRVKVKKEEDFLERDSEQCNSISGEMKDHV